MGPELRQLDSSEKFCSTAPHSTSQQSRQLKPPCSAYNPVTMTSDLESLLDDSQSLHFTGNRRVMRSHPRLTGYRILFFVFTAGFGAVKALFSYHGQTVAPTTLDWMYGVVVVSLLYWLGLYEDECAGKLPCWMFEADAVEGVKELMNRVRAHYQNMSLRILLRKLQPFA
ncbi:hypothetical protein DFH09DRAFT_1002534 [Mycena vulgaris]|nr:hypothetical protein DFH09DRAFT_1002534 [Mycena vulgaris]